MQCPFCQSENREDRETCYVCGKDISTIRLVANKARQHYNDALEHAERGRTSEAIAELQNALRLDTSLVNAHVVLGTLLAREGKFSEARDCWKNALALNPELARAHDYLGRVETVEATLPTIKAYRRVALLLLIVTVGLAAYLIMILRPSPGREALETANTLFADGNFEKARVELDRAQTLAEPGSLTATAAQTLGHSIGMYYRQQVSVIQDLKYRQMYPEALAAMADLEQLGVDTETSGALAAIRQDISYYYRNMLAQLFTSYQQGDLDYETLQGEIQRFVSLYPPSPERDEVQGYLQRALQIELQTAMEELRRRVVLDNNLQTAVEGLRDLAGRFGGTDAFHQASLAFIEEILSNLITVFTGYLDQEEFDKAFSLLQEIDSASADFKEMTDVDISETLDLAWSVYRDSRRQFEFRQIETAISNNQADVAEEILWNVLQEPGLTATEKDLLRSYWRRIDEPRAIQQLLANPRQVKAVFDLNHSDRRASRILELYTTTSLKQLPEPEQVLFTGMAAASALKLNKKDDATSLAKALQKMDAESTVTRKVEQLLNPSKEKPAEPKPAKVDRIRIEPAAKPRQQEEKP